MMSFAYKHFDGQVPEPGDLDAEDRALLAQVEAGFESVGKKFPVEMDRFFKPGDSMVF